VVKICAPEGHAAVDARAAAGTAAGQAAMDLGEAERAQLDQHDHGHAPRQLHGLPPRQVLAVRLRRAHERA
jgi:hypothetical protein